MDKVRYKITETVFCVNEDDETSCYGLKCLKNGKEEICYPDVLPDRKSVEGLVALCNELQADPLHIEDIIEDFLP